ncbi:MAG: serine/threonine-protein kinase [Planctomycetota bacterium]|jgi:tRNA A-37 threonylcarbamoyl transferase component Bud32
MSEVLSCPDCGFEYRPKESLKGLCPRCLMVQLAAEEPEATVAHPPGAGHGFQPPKIEELAPHFPKLEILELLGHGGMSAVYKARQKTLDRVVALKILPQEVAEIAGGAERFARETRTLARLSHPSIVMLYDAGKAGPWCFCLMEFVEGPNLRQFLGDSSLSPGEVLRLIPDICDGLQYAHDQGVVHRDIKPENILLDGHGRAKIADFGLAKWLRPVGSQTATATGRIVGTPHYIAPEQMERPGEVDHRADLYSLGVLLYEMLTGELPVGDFDPPSRKSGSDLRLDDVVLRSLAKDPHRRYQQARDLRSAVLSTASGQPKTFAPPAKRGWGRFAEFFTSGASIAAAIGGVSALVEFQWGRMGDAGFYMVLMCLLWLLSFVLARVNVGWSSHWRDLSVAQCLVTPILLAGYVVIGLVLPLVPAIWICGLASVPLVADVESWQMFGQLFVDDGRCSLLTRYWLSTFGAAALAALAWSVLLAVVCWRRPGICRLLFHPAEEKTAKALALALALFSVVVLLPAGCGLLYVAGFVHSP